MSLFSCLTGCVRPSNNDLPHPKPPPSKEQLLPHGQTTHSSTSEVQRDVHIHINTGGSSKHGYFPSPQQSPNNNPQNDRLNNGPTYHSTKQQISHTTTARPVTQLKESQLNFQKHVQQIPKNWVSKQVNFTDLTTNPIRTVWMNADCSQLIMAGKQTTTHNKKGVVYKRYSIYPFDLPQYRAPIPPPHSPSNQDYIDMSGPRSNTGSSKIKKLELPTPNPPHNSGYVNLDSLGRPAAPLPKK